MDSRHYGDMNFRNQDDGEEKDCLQARALLKNLGPTDSGGHSRIFMGKGLRNTLIQGVRSNQDLNKIKDSNNLVNKT